VVGGGWAGRGVGVRASGGATLTEPWDLTALRIAYGRAFSRISLTGTRKKMLNTPKA
jgi:hypothetical protein